MRSILLALLIIWNLLFGLGGDPILVVQVVLPPGFCDLADWLLDFPGLPPRHETPQQGPTRKLPSYQT